MISIDSVLKEKLMSLAVMLMLTGCGSAPPETSAEKSAEESADSKDTPETVEVEKPKAKEPKKASVATKAELIQAMTTTKSLYADAVDAANDSNCDAQDDLAVARLTGDRLMPMLTKIQDLRQTLRHCVDDSPKTSYTIYFAATNLWSAMEWCDSARNKELEGNRRDAHTYLRGAQRAISLAEKISSGKVKIDSEHLERGELPIPADIQRLDN